jgi:hypothetical protein
MTENLCGRGRGATSSDALAAYVLARGRSATPCPIWTRAVTPNRNRRRQTQHGHATPESTATRILINDGFGTHESPDLMTLCCENDIILCCHMVGACGMYEKGRQT